MTGLANPQRSHPIPGPPSWTSHAELSLNSPPISNASLSSKYFVHNHSASACSVEGTSSPQALHFEARSSTTGLLQQTTAWGGMLALCCTMVSDCNSTTCCRSLMTSASQSGGAGGVLPRFRNLCTDPFQTQFGFVQLFGTLRSPILSPLDPTPRHWSNVS